MDGVGDVFVLVFFRMPTSKFIATRFCKVDLRYLYPTVLQAVYFLMMELTIIFSG